MLGRKESSKPIVANLIVICAREATDDPPAVDDVRRCAAGLVPDNIAPHAPLIYARDRLVTAVVNPVAGIPVHDGCVCLGRMFGPAGRWWEMQTEAPDGSYVIVRHDERSLELLTDILSTRSLWYVQTPQLFLAATSQRALVTLLGSFELNQEAVTWLLTCGHLGAGSWDARLRRLPGDSRLVLDRERWDVQVHQRPAVREPLPLSDAEHVDRLREAIFATCASLDLPMDEWLLPLSGGMDSRMLLLGLLHAGKKPRCVTWGLTSALQDVENDACVAGELAAALGVEHHYYPLDESKETLEAAMRRFVLLSEGQVCDFGGYADGMGIWATFFAAGVAGVIRGDEPAFGYDAHFSSDAQVRRGDGIILLSDYPADHPIHGLGLVEQKLDDSLWRRPDESRWSWDYRLDEEMCSPATLAPLTSIKCAFVEVVNPLQSRRVLQAGREMPNHLRLRDASLATILRSLGPAIPFAKNSALGPASAPLQADSFIAAIGKALSSDSAERILRRPALDEMVAALSQEPHTSRTGRGLKNAVTAVGPRRVIKRLRPVGPVRLSGRQLALRTFIAVQMVDILARDAVTLASKSVA